MKTVAIDCPLFYNHNVFKQEVEKNKDCKKKDNCPLMCDFDDCNFKCYSKILNNEYFDSKNNIYLDIPTKNIDYSSFTGFYFNNEILAYKMKIITLFSYDDIYTYDYIVAYVKHDMSNMHKE
jgi:hypothetical protein